MNSLSIDHVGGEQPLSLHTHGEGDNLDGLHLGVYVAPDLTAPLTGSDLSGDDVAGPLSPFHEVVVQGAAGVEVLDAQHRLQPGEDLGLERRTDTHESLDSGPLHFADKSFHDVVSAGHDRSEQAFLRTEVVENQHMAYADPIRQLEQSRPAITALGKQVDCFVQDLLATGNTASIGRSLSGGHHFLGSGRG
jgi:hypothetical protein